MKKFYFIAFLTLLILGITSCHQRTVSRVDPDSTIDLSGRWNDTDSRLVAEEMIYDALSRPWLSRFENKHDRQPVIIISDVKNRTHEHIDAETFIRNMEKEFINTGLVRVVQGAEFRERIREERADQHEFASPETVAEWRKELGADYMVTGTINSIVDEHGREKVIYYQVNLELSDMATNEKVWLGEKKIKKTVRN
ncbi:MAG: penicillin-binding protein activator LpoB [Bacteroidales bacterium]